MFYYEAVCYILGNKQGTYLKISKAFIFFFALFLGLSLEGNAGGDGREPGAAASFREEQRQAEEAKRLREEAERSKREAKERAYKNRIKARQVTNQKRAEIPYGICGDLRASKLVVDTTEEDALGFYKIYSLDCNQIAAIQVSQTAVLQLRDVFPFKYALTTKFLNSKYSSGVDRTRSAKIGRSPIRVFFDNQLIATSFWLQIGQSEDVGNCMDLTLDLANPNRLNIMAASRLYNFDSLAPLNLQIEADLNQVWLNNYGGCEVPSDYRSFQNLSVWIEKSSLVSICQGLADAKTTEDRVGEVAAKALLALNEVLKRNQDSLAAVLRAYFEETEINVDLTIRALEQNVDKLGVEGRYLIEQLRSISIIKSTPCLREWTIDKMEEFPERFSEQLKLCVENGEITKTNEFLLNSILDQINGSSGNEPSKLKKIQNYLGTIPAIQATTALTKVEIDRRKKLLFQFLENNKRAYNECQNYLK